MYVRGGGGVERTDERASATVSSIDMFAERKFNRILLPKTLEIYAYTRYEVRNRHISDFPFAEGNRWHAHTEVTQLCK